MTVVTNFKVVDRGREPLRCCYNCGLASGPFRNKFGFAISGTRRCSLDGECKDIEWNCKKHVKK